MIVGNIQVGLTGARCCMTAPVTAGLMGAKLEIRYTHPAWQDLGRLVTFQCGKVSRSVLEEDGTVTIPWEVLQKPGTGLTVGITGTDAEDHVVIPTVPLVLCRILPGTQPGEEAAGDPTLPVWAQLDERLRKVEEEDSRKLADALEEAKESGAFQGEAARVTGFRVDYQAWDSGTRVPQGSWQDTPPQVRQGQYLWTRTTLHFNTGDPVVSYSVARMGLDGTGSVSSVANISPDANGNVPLDAEDVGALPNTGGDLTGELRMNGQPISGLNAPTANDQVANMGFVNQQMKKAAPRNLLDNSDFTNPVNQRGQTSYKASYTIDRWCCYDESTLTVQNGYISKTGILFQYIKGIDSGKTYTASVCLRDGTVQVESGLPSIGIGGWNSLFYINYETGTEMLAYRLTTNAVDVVWAALYEGEYTIDTLPEYQPKGYGAELAECQRYFYKVNFSTMYGTGVASSQKVIALLPLPVEMRTHSVTVTRLAGLYAYDGSGETYFVGEGQYSAIANGLYCALAAEVPRDSAISIPDVNLEISADFL